MAEPTDALTTPFACSVITVTSGQVSKRIIADAHGHPKRDTTQGQQINAGTVEHAHLQGLTELAALFERLTSRQALVHGVVNDSIPGELHLLTTMAKVTKQPGAVARSLAYFRYPAPVQLLMFDVDAAHSQHPPDSPEQLLEALAGLWPGMRNVGWCMTVSTSSAIKNKQSGEWLTPPTGMHVYVLAYGNLDRWRSLLRARLWLAGLGRCILATPNAATGVSAILERFLVDLSVFSPERVDYCTGARIAKEAPFVQDRPPPRLHPGALLDLDAWPDLTPEEDAQVNTLIQSARATVAPERAERVRAALRVQAPALPAETIEAQVAHQLLQCDRGILAPDHVLLFANGIQTTAGALTADLDNIRLADPLEPDYGPSHAVLHWRGGDVRIVSFAHGVKRVFEVEPQYPSAPAPDQDEPWPDPDGASAVPWSLFLRRNEKTNDLAPLLMNLVILLTHDGRWRGVLGFDLLAQTATFTARPPFLPDDGKPWTTRPITDHDDRETACWLQQQHQSSSSSGQTAEALQTVAARHAYHPIRDYLASLTWDGTARLDTWLTTYAHAEDTDYVRAVSKNTLLAAVARVMYPGCKADTVCILENEQGTLKSTLWRVLASDAWFSDSLPDFHSKDAAQTLRGKWIIELGELAALARSELEAVKRFLSSTSDYYRPSYGRRAQDFPRENIFVGSTNREAYLKDDTGNRRFLPVKLTQSCDIPALQRDRDQLWAEAMHALQRGDTWHMPASLEGAAAAEQAERYEQDPWEESVLTYVRGLSEVTSKQVFEYGLQLEKPHWTLANGKRVGSILRAHGWRRQTIRDIDGEPVSGFKRLSVISVISERTENESRDYSKTTYKNNDVTSVISVIPNTLDTYNTQTNGTAHTPATHDAHIAYREPSRKTEVTQVTEITEITSPPFPPVSQWCDHCGAVTVHTALGGLLQCTWCSALPQATGGHPNGTAPPLPTYTPEEFEL